MTGPTREVLHALVRLMNGEIDYTDLDDETLYALGAAARHGRQTLHEVVLELRRRDVPFAEMARRWGVDRITPTRWAEPPSPPGRRRAEDDD